MPKIERVVSWLDLTDVGTKGIWNNLTPRIENNQITILDKNYCIVGKIRVKSELVYLLTKRNAKIMNFKIRKNPDIKYAQRYHETICEYDIILDL